jgi:hypothetical protein
LTNILRLGWGGISCPFMTSHGLSLREAPWSAVAAATAFLALALARLRDESMAEGGSCCYQGRLLRHEGRPHRTRTHKRRSAAAPPRCATPSNVGRRPMPKAGEPCQRHHNAPPIHQINR